jgi:hypothetical protein
MKYRLLVSSVLLALATPNVWAGIRDHIDGFLKNPQCIEEAQQTKPTPNGTLDLSNEKVRDLLVENVKNNRKKSSAVGESSGGEESSAVGESSAGEESSAVGESSGGEESSGGGESSGGDMSVMGTRLILENPKALQRQISRIPEDDDKEGGEEKPEDPAEKAKKELTKLRNAEKPKVLQRQISRIPEDDDKEGGEEKPEDPAEKAKKELTKLRNAGKMKSLSEIKTETTQIITMLEGLERHVFTEVEARKLFDDTSDTHANMYYFLRDLGHLNNVVLYRDPNVSKNINNRDYTIINWVILQYGSELFRLWSTINEKDIRSGKRVGSIVLPYYILIPLDTQLRLEEVHSRVLMRCYNNSYWDDVFKE